MPKSPGVTSRFFSLARGVASPSRRLDGTSIIVFLAVGLSGLAMQCNAEDATYLRRFTAEAGGGLAPVTGNYANGLSQPGYNLLAGAGFAVYRPDVEYDSRGIAVSPERWSIYLMADFMFNQSQFEDGAAAEAAKFNPQYPGLLSANGGRTKFFSATFGPVFRCPPKGKLHMSPYVFAGYGWLRRDVQLTGVSIQGPLYQPSSPVVAQTGGSSGAIAFGGGSDLAHIQALGGMRFFAEVRVLHGLGINSGTTIAPTFGVRW